MVTRLSSWAPSVGMDLDLAETFDRLEQAVGTSVFALVCQAFLQDFPTRLAQLDAALELGDPAAAIAPAHTLKGDAASFGAEHLSLLAAELEARCRRAEQDLTAPLSALHDEVARVSNAIALRLSPAGSWPGAVPRGGRQAQ